MQFLSSIQALASLTFLAAVVSAAGAHIEECDGSNNQHYQGGSGCVKWDYKNFEVAKLGKQCTGKFQSLVIDFWN